jgi:uncharacterized delta-60 repeat protein
MRNTTLLLLSVSLPCLVPSAGADGMLDPSFGNGGLVTTAFPGQFSSDAAMSLVLLPDGRAVAAGSTNENLSLTEMAVARYLTTGALDTTFDGDGLVTVFFIPPPGGFDIVTQVQTVLLQPDGRLVLVGYFFTNAPTSTFFALARLNADGSLDASFGTGGKVITAVPDAQAVAGLLQPDGRIVVVGSTFGNSSVILARYNVDASLDTTFGTSGLILLPMAQPFEARDIALQQDGKILVAGRVTAPSGSWDFGLLRLLSNGSLDPSFDGDGIVSTDFGGYEAAYSVIVLPDGRLVLAGSRSTVMFGVTDFALARYQTDGALDTTFGTGGLATGDSGASEVPDQLIRLYNGNLLVGGFTNDNGGNADFLLARFLPDGALDTSFGTAGFVRTDFAAGSLDECHAVAIAGPDRILTAGRTGPSFFPADFGLARYVATTPVELLSFAVE